MAENSTSDPAPVGQKPAQTEQRPRIVMRNGTVSLPAQNLRHEEMDRYGKANGLTIVFAPWHPIPEYKVFVTGSLLSRNEDYPSGLIIVDYQPGRWGVHPRPWRKV